MLPQPVPLLRQDHTAERSEGLDALERFGSLEVHMH
jgi:hypothetical protein